MGLCFFFYEKDVLKLDSSFIQFLGGIYLIPLVIKPFYGFIIDQLLKKVKKAKFILIVLALCQMLVNMTIAFLQLTTFQFVFLAIIIEIIRVNENILIETLLVKSTKKANWDSKNSFRNNHLLWFFGFKLLGTIIGLLFQGRIIDKYGVTQIYYIGVFIPLITIIISVFYKEEVD